MNLIGKLRKEKEFRQQYYRNSTKIREKNRKSWREKEEEFRQHCYRNSSTQIPTWSCVLCAQVWSAQKKKKKSNLWQWHCRKWGKKIEWNYGNVIVENERKKKMLLSKSGKKF